MNKTASRLAASVQRAKSQPVNTTQDSTEDVAVAVAASAAAESPAPAEAQQRPARAARSPSRAAKAATESQAAAAPESLGNGDHNGGQPNFPNRVWPD